MIMGFGNNIEGESSIYDVYIGRPGQYGVGAIAATGILKEVNTEEGYILVQPSIVGHKGNYRLEKDIPTTITMERGQPISMRPLQEGDLEEIVKDNN